MESCLLRKVSGCLCCSSKIRADVVISFDRGILIPGGFGLRGTEGMVKAAQWAREKKVPFLGICLGFQIAVIEFARNVCGLQGELSHMSVPINLSDSLYHP